MSYAQTRTAPFGVIHEPATLADKVFVDFMQRMPQLTGWRACRAVAALTPEDMHDFPDPLDRDLGVFRVAVPDPPAQPLDLLDNERLCLHPARFVGRQRTRRQLRVLKPHRDMKPIENRWLRHARSGQDRPKAGTTIGERGQVTVVGSAHGLEVSADQHRDVGVALRDRAKYLPISARRLDVADANLQMAFAIVAAADESRIQTDADRRRRGRRPGRGHVAKPLADFQRIMAKCLRARTGLNRQKMLQHISGDAISHQGGKMRLKLIQLWRRPTMRRPTHAHLNPATSSTEASRQPHRHSTEQSRDLMRSPVLDVAFSIAG